MEQVYFLYARMADGLVASRRQILRGVVDPLDLCVSQPKRIERNGQRLLASCCLTCVPPDANKMGGDATIGGSERICRTSTSWVVAVSPQ